MRRCSYTSTWTILFVMAVSVVSASILSLLASGLKGKREQARELDRSQQLLLSARVYSAEGFFLLPSDGGWVRARYVGHGELAPGEGPKASPQEVFEVYKRRVRPCVVDREGRMATYAQAGLDEKSYMAQWKFANRETATWLPLFAILPNDGAEKPESYVIPISGMGLWDRIFGYLDVAPDGKTVQGVAWYDQKETPGLGGEISEPSWQAQFRGKKIFQAGEDGTIDVARSPIGIRVVKGRVQDLYGTGPKSYNAVDGISGATLTGKGVTKAYIDSLELYRPFFVRVQGGV